MDRVKQKPTSKAPNEEKKEPRKSTVFKAKYFVYFLLFIILFLIIFPLLGTAYFEDSYKNKVYPGIKVGDLDAGGKTKQDIEDYFSQKSFPFSKINITFSYEDVVATLSAKELNLAFDGKLSAEQAYMLGRSGNVISDTYQKINALKNNIYLPTIFHINNNVLDDFLANLADRIDIEPEDALFTFENSRVSAFKLSKDGRKLDKERTVTLLNEYFKDITSAKSIDNYELKLPLPVSIVKPNITTSGSNSFGIKELIGSGQSKFAHSINERMHNISLAASRINGRLIPPGGIFSFNDAVGDISAATGFQPAYIIKDGKTVLGDGGGVCQVSTTLFRAALNTGLPIVERWAHAYRVGYYEQDSPPGFDATVYAPSYDLKIKNDTANYILIQAVTDTNKAELAFNLYGTSDGREVEISSPRIYDQSPPPPDLYQDDPTLSAGVVKQTDFAAWGAKVNFNYKVVESGNILSEQNFFSNYRPWQAVYLKGTKS